MTPFVYRDGDIELIGEACPPEGEPNGRAVLVAHEADGIGGNVRRRCAKLAGLGYAAFAVDLHGGGRVLEGAEMRAALDAFRAEPERLRRRIGAGLDAVCAQGFAPERVAAIGYCFGGLAVLELARSGAAPAAVASFHGLLTTRAPARAGAIRTRVAAFTGALDPLVPPEDVAAFQAEMMTAEADWRLIVYGRALHSFTNEGVRDLGDPRMAYDAEADADSWAECLRFLDDAFGA